MLFLYLCLINNNFEIYTFKINILQEYPHNTMKKKPQLHDRWKKAQEYELNWWQKYKAGISVEYYKNSASEIRKYLHQENIRINTDTCVLEVGSGMCGILTYLNESNKRFAIDPLESACATVPEFIRARDQSVRYFTAKGEDIPFEDGMFDLVILDNVLDHCENPTKVISEIKRVLKIGGVLYFRQNTYNFYGKLFRSIMELFLIDKGHPYTFTKTYLRKCLKQQGLKFVTSTRSGYWATWKSEILSGNLKDKVKALLFVTRDRVTYLIRKQ